MRLLFLASAVILATAAGAAAPSQQAGNMPVVNPNAGSPTDCPPTSRYEAARRGGPLGARRLNELPAADMYKAVYRHIGRCEAPIIVGYGFGGSARRR
jgi:hypothetical protein